MLRLCSRTRSSWNRSAEKLFPSWTTARSNLIRNAHDGVQLHLRIYGCPGSFFWRRRAGEISGLVQESCQRPVLPRRCNCRLQDNGQARSSTKARTTGSSYAESTVRAVEKRKLQAASRKASSRANGFEAIATRRPEHHKLHKRRPGERRA